MMVKSSYSIYIEALKRVYYVYSVDYYIYFSIMCSREKKSKNFGIFSLDCSEMEHSFAIFFRFIFFIFSVFRFQ